MRLLHSLARTHASFDDPNLVSRAGLVPVMALAQRAGLTELVAGQVRPGGPCGVNAHVKVPCLVAGMIGGADSINDMDLLRHGAVAIRDAVFAARTIDDVSATTANQGSPYTPPLVRAGPGGFRKPIKALSPGMRSRASARPTPTANR